ncbi:hypothetical protein PTKIN_Ptkin06aG0169500 [Pterospermum kingtungense]
MAEMNQESDFEVPKEEDDDLQESINLSLLHLDNVKSNHQNRHGCATCACNVTASKPMKRPSPEPISEPKSKKPLLDNHHNPLSGFSKLPLPQLQRSTSDPSCTPPKLNLSENKKALEDSPLSKGNVSCSSVLPPKVPVLRRTISEPIVSPVKSCSRSSSSNEMGMELTKEESPNIKRLKRMRKRMKEMRQWWDEALREVEDACTTETEAINVCFSNFLVSCLLVSVWLPRNCYKEKENLILENAGVDCEEAVRVEKTGECLDLHFKCPCGKGYQILLSGKNCYYKLI